MSKKNILLAITGLSPQVITETLYGIIQSNLEWPDEIQIITTLKGKEQARLGLITPLECGRSMLERLCIDYKMPLPRLVESQIHTVPGSDGFAVNDAKTVEDQEALADYILKHVGFLCDDSSNRVHASIAGGRKTMTFYLGYAMTLFARPDDRLSHVLVDERYENNRDFYYPTPYTHVIAGRFDNQKVDAKEATVVLSEIPFIRQRTQFRPEVYHSLKNESYRDMVRVQNLSYMDNINVILDIDQCVLTVSSDKLEKNISFQQSVLEFAFFLYAIRLNQQGVTMSRLGDGEYSKKHAILYMKELDRVHGYLPPNGSYEEQLQLREDHLAGRSRTLSSLKYGISNTFIDQRKNTLKRKLRSVFPGDFVDVITNVIEYETSFASKIKPEQVIHIILEGDYHPFPIS